MPDIHKSQSSDLLGNRQRQKDAKKEDVPVSVTVYTQILKTLTIFTS